MDQINLDIPAHLQQDGRKPFTEIAKDLSISEGMVRKRVARLSDERVVQIVGLVDPYKLGLDAPTMIGITIADVDIEVVAAEITTFSEVSYLVMVSGEYDFIVEVQCRDREHFSEFLNQRLRKFQGVHRTRTFMILDTYIMSSGSQPRLSAAERIAANANDKSGQQ